MAKARTVYFCQSCGAQSSKWLGNCPACGEWNTYVEELVEKEKPKSWELSKDKSVPQKAVRLNDIQESEDERILLKDNEFNRVLGGGIVKGSVVLIGGEPGIGKSTLLLQMSLSLNNLTVLYVSGEESEHQIKMRASRMKENKGDCFILPEVNIEKIFRQCKDLDPAILVIDSIQTLFSNKLDSPAGSISQIRECTSELQRFAKISRIPVFLVGHITKDGSIAGPKVLEHIVDTVLQFEGDTNYTYRILRTNKNRFGSTSEIGLYEMSSTGLREVSNPSEILISQRDDWLSGISIGSTIEGIRPMLIEIQALVARSVFSSPQRSTTGFDNRRLNMLLAVLEKRLGIFMGNRDVFVNIAGGLRVTDPGIDLAMIIALISSYEDKVVSPKYCFAGEIGLSGEIRAVNRLEQRINEAGKLGFEKIVVSSFNKVKSDSFKDIEVIKIGKITDLAAMLFGEVGADILE